MMTNEHEILDTSDDESDLDRSHRSYAQMAASFDENEGIHQSRVKGSNVQNRIETVDVSSKEKSIKVSPPEIEGVASGAFSQFIQGVIFAEKFNPSLALQCTSFISQSDSEGLKQQPTNTTESPTSQPYQLPPTDKKQEEEPTTKGGQMGTKGEQMGTKGKSKETKREAPLQNQHSSLNEIMERQVFNEGSQAQKVSQQVSDEMKNLRIQPKKLIQLCTSRQKSGLSRGVLSRGVLSRGVLSRGVLSEDTHLSSKKSIEQNVRWPNESCSINPMSEKSKNQRQDNDEIGLCSRPNLDKFKETSGSSPLNNNSSKNSIASPLQLYQQSIKQDPDIMLESHQNSKYKVTPTADQKQKGIAKLSLEHIQPDFQNKKNMEIILTRIHQLQSIITDPNRLNEEIIPELEQNQSIFTEQSLLFSQAKKLKFRDQGNSQRNYKSNELNCISSKDASRRHQELKAKLCRQGKDMLQGNEVQRNRAQRNTAQRNTAQRNTAQIRSMEMRQMHSEDDTSIDSSRQLTEDYLSEEKHCWNDFAPSKINQKCSLMKLTFEKVNEIVRRPCFQKKPEQNDAANLLLEKAMRIYQALDLNVRHISSIKLSLNRNFVSFESDEEPKQKMIWHFSGKIYVGQVHFTSDYQYQKHGKGIEYEPDQYVYYGQYRKDKMHGSGAVNFFNSHTYDGHWCNGLMDGTGIFITAKGDHYQGNFHLGKKQGYGREDYADENIYIGEFSNGMRHGKGVFKWKNGASYRGQFYKSMKHGLGAWKSEFGDSYEGSYENDEKHGHGLYCKRNGKFMECVFKRGKLLHNLQKPASNTLEEEQQLPPDIPFESGHFQANSFKKEYYQRPRKYKS